jgi:tetratricopeptide (TPR) repeat protein
VRLSEGAYYRGLIYLEQGKYREALDEFDLVVKQQPDFWPVYLLRARACFWLGEQKERQEEKVAEQKRGLAELDSYLAGGRRGLDPTSAEAHQLRGTLLRRLLTRREVPRTLSRLTFEQLLEAVKRGGQSAALFHELGAMLDRPGQAEKAVEFYRRGLERDPGNVRLLILRGWACAQHLKVPDYKQAQADFAQAVKLTGDQREAWPLRAAAYSGLGFVHARKEALTEAQNAAALALLNRGDGDESYLIVHNVACIFAVLGEVDTARARAHEDVALEHIRRAVEVWRRGGKKGPNEIDLVKREPAFRGLKKRPEFQKLIEDAKQ